MLPRLTIAAEFAILCDMAALIRIEALPGDGRYAVAFERPDGSEQHAVVQITADGVDVAEASLPVGWSRDSDAFSRTAAAVAAFHDARRFAPAGPALRDIEGGWDVSLGNVTLVDGVPTCAAHGPMGISGDQYFCTECDARAKLI